MPRAADILDGLSAIASQATSVAVAWHILIGTALLALLSGWRPSQRTARLLIGMPLASVAAVAIAFANPFNGLVFTASALAMTALAMRGDRRPVYLGSAWTRAIGAGDDCIRVGLPALPGRTCNRLSVRLTGRTGSVSHAGRGDRLRSSREWSGIPGLGPHTRRRRALLRPVRRIAPRRVPGHSTHGWRDRSDCRRVPLPGGGRPRPRHYEGNQQPTPR